MPVDPSDFPDEWKTQSAPAAPAATGPIDPTAIRPIDPNAQQQPSGPQPTFQDAPGVGVVDVTSPTNPIVSGFGKPFAGLAGGAGQLYGDVTGRTPQWAQRASQYALSPNESWVGTGAEALGWLPIGAAASRLGPFAAPALGGFYATPTGSVASHGVGAGTGWLGQQIFGRAFPAMARWWANRLPGSRQIPQLATREFAENALKGTGITLASGDVTGAELARVTREAGEKLEQVRSTMNWTPDFGAMQRQSSQVLQQIRDPSMQTRWSDLFNKHVFGAAAPSKGKTLGGEDFAHYVNQLRTLARSEIPQFGDNFPDDKRIISKALRQFADEAEKQSTGTNKQLLQRLTEANGQLGTLNRAAPPSKGNVATPARLLNQRTKELKSNAAARTRAQTDPMLNRLETLRQRHEEGRRFPGWMGHVAHYYGPAALMTYPIARSLQQHAGIPFEYSWPALIALGGSPQFQQMADYAATLSRTGAPSAARTAEIASGPLGGALGAYSNQLLDQGPTGGVTP